MKKKIIIGLIILIIIGGVVVQGMGDDEDQMAVSVETRVLEEEDLTQKVEADGNVIISNRQKVRSDLAGTVAEVFVKEGDSVIKGEALLRLEYDTVQDDFEVFSLVEKNEPDFTDRLLTEEMVREQNRVREAERTLREAKLALEEKNLELEERVTELGNEIEDLEFELDRVRQELAEDRELYNYDAITARKLRDREREKEKLEIELARRQDSRQKLIEERKPNTLARAQNKVEEAENALTEAEFDFQQRKARLTELLNKLEVTAPKTGTLVNFDVDVGDKLTSQTMVGEIASLKDLALEVAVDEIDVNRVEPGQMVEISSDAFSPVLAGRVNRVAPEVKEAGNVNEYITNIVVEDT